MKLSHLLVVTLASVGLLASGTAFAEERKSNLNMISKQPYLLTPSTKNYKADDKWEGATLVEKEEASSKNQARKSNLHMISRQPYFVAPEDR